MSGDLNARVFAAVCQAWPSPLAPAAVVREVADAAVAAMSAELTFVARVVDLGQIATNDAQVVEGLTACLETLNADRKSVQS